MMSNLDILVCLQAPRTHQTQRRPVTTSECTLCIYESRCQDMSRLYQNCGNTSMTCEGGNESQHTFFSSRHIFTRHLLHQTPFTPDTFTPNTFYTTHLLHQAPFTPDTFHTKHLLHQTPSTPDTLYTKHLLHQTPFTPNTFYTRQLLHQTTFSLNTCYNRHLLHQVPFTPDNFYTRQLLHQTTFTPGNFYTNLNFYTNQFYTRHLLHQPAFTPDTFYTNQLLHQTPFTPDTFYSKHLSHQATFYTKHLLHQTPFTPDAFYTRHPLHQPTFTPGTFYTKHLLHQTPFTRDAFYTRHLFTRHLSHQALFTPDNFYTRQLLHYTVYTRHLLHQTTFTPDTFYTKHLLYQAHLHQTPFYSTKNTTTKTPPQKLSCLHHHKNTTPAQTDQAGCGTPGRQTRVDSSLWPQSTVPKLPSGTNGCQTLKSGTLNTSYFCQKSPLCQPPPSPTPPPNSHFVRKVKLRLAYRLAFVIRKETGKVAAVLWVELATSPPGAMGKGKENGNEEMNERQTVKPIASAKASVTCSTMFPIALPAISKHLYLQSLIMHAMHVIYCAYVICNHISWNRLKQPSTSSNYPTIYSWR